MSNLKCPQTTIALNKYSKCIHYKETKLETSDDIVYYTSIEAIRFYSISQNTDS